MTRAILCIVAAALLLGVASHATALHTAAGYSIETIANVKGARELAALPNGDLLVGTEGDSVALVSNAEGSSSTARVFARFDDRPTNGVAYAPSAHTIFVATQHSVYAIPYHDGDSTARSAKKIASIRTGGIAPNSDGDIHTTSSVAVSGTTLYVGVGSSCNACIEIDPARATIQSMQFDGSAMQTRAKRYRNAIALAVDPTNGHLWAGGAGQDDLPTLHPYEFIDDVSSHAGVADYGWPACEEHHVAYIKGADCSKTVEPLVEFPAYATLIGAVFYPVDAQGAHVIPALRGSLVVTLHGSWHSPGGCNVAPEVDVIPMHGGRPQTAVDWNDPKRQWKPLVTGFQAGCAANTRVGRPTGITVDTSGSLFFADGTSGAIYRIR